MALTFVKRHRSNDPELDSFLSHVGDGPLLEHYDFSGFLGVLVRS